MHYDTTEVLQDNVRNVKTTLNDSETAMRKKDATKRH